MTFQNYLEEFILKPANLSNTFYFTGAPGAETEGLRKGVVSLPGYMTTFEGGSGETPSPNIHIYTLLILW